MINRNNLKYLMINKRIKKQNKIKIFKKLNLIHTMMKMKMMMKIIIIKKNNKCLLYNNNN